MTIPFPALLFLTGFIASVLLPSTSFAAGSSLHFSSVQSLVAAQLGEALPEPELQTEDYASESGIATRSTGGWSVDASDRVQVQEFFYDVYLASVDIPFDWTGDIAACDAGDTGVEFRSAVLTRINYFRAMAGVPASIVFDPILNAKAQEAALMMDANDGLSHAPPTSWICYSADGADAAASSNLALGTNGWNAISLYMLDPGSGNAEVGHRRWVLMPQTETMGTGDVPDANALWVITSEYLNPLPPSRDGFVAWPTRGYNPYQEVPIRWSFTYPNADFSAATVYMTEDGIPITSTIDSRINQGISATIVWRPKDLDASSYFTRWPRPGADIVYDVTLENVLIDNVAQSFTYSVAVIDPATPDTDGDGVPDFSDTDDDNDGLTDDDELNVYKTDPLKSDTDDDGMPDDYEVQNELEPLVDDASQDKDGDGFTNLEEYTAGTAANDPGDRPESAGAIRIINWILLGDP